MVSQSIREVRVEILWPCVTEVDEVCVCLLFQRSPQPQSIRNYSSKGIRYAVVTQKRQTHTHIYAHTRRGGICDERTCIGVQKQNTARTKVSAPHSHCLFS